MELQAAVDEFLLDLESYGRKESTMAFYRVLLGQAVLFWAGQDCSQVGSLTRSSFRAFFAELSRRKRSEDTLAAYDRTLRSFTAFCVGEGWLAEDPMALRKRLRQATNKLPDTLNFDEIARLLATCDGSIQGRRDRAMMLLLLDTGLRASEEVNLTMSQVEMNGDRGTVFIPASGSKGKSDRTVPFWTETLNVLKNWLPCRPEGSGTVFVRMNGHQQAMNKPLTRNGLNQMIHERAKLAGVTGKHRWCHIWRHTFARHYVLGGGDLETLRRMLGHSSLETVRIYLRFLTEDLEARHFDLSPVRQLFAQGGK